MRDFKYWDDKHTKANIESRLLEERIYYRSAAPKKRRKGTLTTFKAWFTTGTYKRMFRSFNYRNSIIYEKKYRLWVIRQTKVAVMRHRKKMLDTTKIPYYKERIVALGQTPTNEW